MGFWNNLGKAADKTYSTTMTITEAIQDWVKNHPKEMRIFEKHGIEPDVDVLLKDNKYREVRFDTGMSSGQTACKILDGKFCYTVGEYQDRHNELYGPGGKYYEG